MFHGMIGGKTHNQNFPSFTTNYFVCCPFKVLGSILYGVIAIQNLQYNEDMKTFAGPGTTEPGQYHLQVCNKENDTPGQNDGACADSKLQVTVQKDAQALFTNVLDCAAWKAVAKCKGPSEAALPSCSSEMQFA